MFEVRHEIQTWPLICISPLSSDFRDKLNKTLSITDVFHLATSHVWVHNCQRVASQPLFFFFCEVAILLTMIQIDATVFIQLLTPLMDLQLKKSTFEALLAHNSMLDSVIMIQKDVCCLCCKENNIFAILLKKSWFWNILITKSRKFQFQFAQSMVDNKVKNLLNFQ